MSTILIVDDEADIRLMLRLALSVEPHRIVEAVNGEDALSMLREEAVDLMLLDIMMPILDGREVLRRLGPDFTTPTVVVTGLQTADGRHVAELLELGALDVVAKPFDLSLLLGMVHAVLQVDPAERTEYRRRRLDQARGGG